MKNKSVFLPGIIALLSLFVLWGCPKKAEVSATPETPQETAPVVEPAPAPAPEPVKEEPKVEQKAEPLPELKEEPRERAAVATAGLQPVYFDFDRAFIRDDAKAIMRSNADWLKANPRAKVRVEGNCDERGTKEYNQALGQRRAASAKKYLTDLGISAKRLSLISYGKEKPVCTESNEECWQKNRRDDLVAVTE
jgi:peptidoglycan-associated lipoprotein